jgi:hypothetical protein
MDDENEFDVNEDYEMADDCFDEPFDSMLEQQELEDFAQDGYFENMEPMEGGFWG